MKNICVNIDISNYKSFVFSYDSLLFIYLFKDKRIKMIHRKYKYEEKINTRVKINNLIYDSKFFKLTLLNQKVIHSYKHIVYDEYFIKNTFKNYEDYYTEEFLIHCEKMELERNLKQTNQNKNNNKKVVKI